MDQINIFNFGIVSSHKQNDSLKCSDSHGGGGGAGSLI